MRMRNFNSDNYIIINENNMCVIARATEENLHEHIIRAIVNNGSSRNIKVYREHNIKIPSFDDIN